MPHSKKAQPFLKRKYQAENPETDIVLGEPLFELMKSVDPKLLVEFLVDSH